jgi:hypothetical protein
MTSPRRLFALLALLPALAASPAVVISATAPSRGDEASARSAVLARFDAALRADIEALDGLLADDLDYCSFLGTCESKRQYLEAVKSGALRYRSFEPAVDRVKLFSDSAVVTGTLRVRAIRDGADRTIRISYAAVLAWRDNRWQMTTWTSTLLEAPKTG